MNLKRASLIALAAFVIPSVAAAQITQRIHVTKDFTDGNDTDVIVSYECNDGLPSSGMATVSPGPIGHTFVIEELTGDIPVECIVTESDAAGMGYSAAYTAAAGEDVETTDDGCKFFWIGMVEADAPLPDDDDGYADWVMFSLDGDASCDINNRPDLVPVVVTKEWDLTGTQEIFEDTDARINVFSRAYFERLNGKGEWVAANCRRPNQGPCNWSLRFSGENPDAQSIMVRPENINGVDVELEERGVDSYVDASDDCGGVVEVKANQGGSCTFTNVVFYEGIPTLSQYGLAIMALLMLGVGFVGFRRFV